jgi:DNA-binding LacI/PurR family transcriptional regulator
LQEAQNNGGFAGAGGGSSKKDGRLHAKDAAMILPFQPGIEGGRRLAETLIHLPPRQAPDGLVIPDDYAVAELIHCYASAGRTPPQIAVLTNRQAPIHFDAPVLAFEADIDELAERAIAFLQSRISGTVDPAYTELVAPKPRETRSLEKIHETEPVT